MDISTLLIALLVLIILWFVVNYFAKPTVYISDRKKKHSWKSKNEQNSFYCNVCEFLLTSSGFVCEYCSVACDKHECMKIADRKLKCKELRIKKSISADQFQHHLIPGNLINSQCYVCKLEIENVHEPGIHGMRCCWCQESFHDSCSAKEGFGCDFGEYREFIIPPFSVKASRTRDAPQLHLTEITPVPKWKNWRPLIVIANTKSGSSEAEHISSLFKSILNPIQVIMVSAFHSPKEALQIALKLAPLKCRIVVAGGDGSVAWVLNTIHEMNLESVVEVAICPIGTGNDLSRVMGWGSEINDEDLQSPKRLIERIRNAETVQLDRWHLEIKYDKHSIISKRLLHDKNMFMYNYLSVGVDALVTLNFHKARASPIYVVKSKIINKLMYFIYGTHQVVMQDCEGLQEKLELHLDGVKIELPELQSVIVLNIDSWGAGVKLIQMTKETDKKFADDYSVSDGMLEVFGVVSSFHIAQLQVGIGKPIKLGRAKEVRVSL